MLRLEKKRVLCLPNKIQKRDRSTCMNITEMACTEHCTHSNSAHPPKTLWASPLSFIAPLQRSMGQLVNTVIISD